jgi:predicted aldo/keto reductase-like oxidoreductase
MKDRRTFLKTMAVATAGIMVAKPTLSGCSAAVSDRMGELLPQRLLGSTGEKVTMLGLGGAHIGIIMDEPTSEKVIEAAIEGGIRFFDNAWGYADGLAEERFGKFLVPKYRDISFIMTKTPARSGEKAMEHLETSLKRMKTDYIDLWQIHSVNTKEDVDRRLQDGVVDALVKAKESGKVRYVGFTGHNDYRTHSYVLEKTDVLETCQMPVNCFDPNYESFIINVLPALVERNMGVIAMKSLSNGGFFGGTRHMHGGDKPKIIPEVATMDEALNFVWSLPVSVIVSGAHDVGMLNEKIELAKSFRKMDEDKRNELVERLLKGGFEGKYVEHYKFNQS